MNNDEKKESVIASYELTSESKNDDTISESEVNDMLNESGEGSGTASNNSKRTHSLPHFLYKNLLWLILCIAVFAMCILASNLYFRMQDKKTMNAVSDHEINPINLDLASDLTLLDKINIINNECYYTDLNFDYTDKYSYSEIHDIAVKELTSYFSDIFSCDFTVNGIYEMYISKYLATSNEDNYRSFTVWVINISYFGFDMNCLMDYDTNKMVSFTLNINPEDNSFYGPDDLQEHEYYFDYISPLYTYLDAHTYTSASGSSNTDMYNYFTDIMSTYYELDNATSTGGVVTPDNNATYDSSSKKTVIGSFDFSIDDETYSMYMKIGPYTFQMNRYFYI